MKLPTWLQFKKTTTKDKSQKLLLNIRKKTSGVYTKSKIHWRVLKVATTFLMLLIGFGAYYFYDRVNQGAFESTADVVATGVQDIDVQNLLDILVQERENSAEFAELVGNPVVSFDPSFYDVELRPVSKTPSTTTTTQEFEL